MRVVQMTFPGGSTRNVLTIKDISNSPDFIQVVVATPSGAVTAPVPRGSTVRQAIVDIMNEVNNVRMQNLHTLNAQARRCLPTENFRMDRLWRYEGYIGLVPWRPPFSNITGYYSRATAALGLVADALLPRCLIDIIGAYNTHPPYLQEEDLYETHTLDATLEDSTTEGAKRGPVFISIASTAEQLYRRYQDLCPFKYMIKDVETRQTFSTQIVTDLLPEDIMRSYFDYNSKHCDDAHLRYLNEQRLLRSCLNMKLTIGLQTVRFWNYGTLGHFVMQAPNMGQVLEKTLRCYENFLASEGTDPATIGKWQDDITIWHSDPRLKSTRSTVDRLPRNMRLCACLTLYVEMVPLVMAWPPGKKITFRSHIYEMVANCLLNTLRQSDSELEGSQVALEMANNSCLLVRDPVGARRAIMENVENS
jgi:hypothetical protein